MKVTYYGHACFAVETNGKKLLFDPFITPNEKASHIDISQLNPDYVLISHGHGDHIADAEQIIKQSGAKLISSYEIVEWFGKKGIEGGHPMNHGGNWNFDFGTVKVVNAIHSSSFPDGSYAGNPMGFVITTAEGSFYYAGDTALTLDMQLIGEAFTLSFALLPIGDNFTMDMKDAVKAAKLIKCQNIIGLHYDTFPYIEIDHEKAKEGFSNAGLNLHLLDIGESKGF